jgi:glycosyltransferase involved in cell wall biosynthesis
MKNEPKISVVMSVYNGDKYLQEAVDSILNQTFKDFEFIIINDGSTDDTREILESYNDPRIVLIHQENIGLTKSLNKGIALAKGEYIARQDADDLSMPERLEKQLAFLEKHNKIALLGTAIKSIDHQGIYLKMTKFPRNHSSIQKIMKHENCFYHGSVMFKRHCFIEAGGYREIFSTSQDYDLWLRFAEKFEVANLLTPLYKYRFNRQSISFKKIVFQRKMSRFAKQLASAREKGISEALLFKDLKQFLESPLSIDEKKKIFQRYIHWALLFLDHNNKNEALFLMSEFFRNHYSSLYRRLFKIKRLSQSVFLLKLLITLNKILLMLPAPANIYLYFLKTSLP